MVYINIPNEDITMTVQKINNNQQQRYKKIAIAAGAVGLVAAGIYFYKKRQLNHDIFQKTKNKANNTPLSPKPKIPQVPTNPKIQDVTNVTPESKLNGIAKTEQLPKEDGLIFKCGVLYKADNEKYTGIFERQIDPSTSFKIKYENGLPIESYKNDSLIKKWSYITSESNPNEKVITISEFSENRKRPDKKTSLLTIKDKLRKITEIDHKNTKTRIQDLYQNGKHENISEYFGVYDGIEPSELLEKIEFDVNGEEISRLTRIKHNMYELENSSGIRRCSIDSNGNITTLNKKGVSKILGQITGFFRKKH